MDSTINTAEPISAPVLAAVATVEKNAELNLLVARAFRSLLQYTIESSVWTGSESGTPAERTIREMIDQQQTIVERIVRLLERRGWPIDFGNYADFSGLNYVSLKFLLGRIIADEQELIATIERVQPQLREDPAARALAEDLLADEKARLKTLRDLAAATKS
jgi:hypothetical protein